MTAVTWGELVGASGGKVKRGCCGEEFGEAPQAKVLSPVYLDQHALIIDTK